MTSSDQQSFIAYAEQLLLDASDDQVVLQTLYNTINEVGVATAHRPATSSSEEPVTVCIVTASAESKQANHVAAMKLFAKLRLLACDIPNVQVDISTQMPVAAAAAATTSCMVERNKIGCCRKAERNKNNSSSSSWVFNVRSFDARGKDVDVLLHTACATGLVDALVAQKIKVVVQEEEASQVVADCFNHVVGIQLNDRLGIRRVEHIAATVSKWWALNFERKQPSSNTLAVCQPSTASQGLRQRAPQRLLEIRHEQHNRAGGAPGGLQFTCCQRKQCELAMRDGHEHVVVTVLQTPETKQTTDADANDDDFTAWIARLKLLYPNYSIKLPEKISLEAGATNNKVLVSHSVAGLGTISAYTFNKPIASKWLVEAMCFLDQGMTHAEVKELLEETNETLQILEEITIVVHTEP